MTRKAGFFQAAIGAIGEKRSGVICANATCRIKPDRAMLAYENITMSGVMEVARTDRLLLRWLDADDAGFILELLNEPPWIRYIGDKKVQTLQDAQRYIRNGPAAMYERLGFGLYLVQLKQGGEPIGICGLIKREALDDVDLGFAFLQRFWGNGYAFEAAAAIMAYGTSVLGLSRLVAILSPDNLRSHELLKRLGFRPEGEIRLGPDDKPVALYAFAA